MQQVDPDTDREDDATPAVRSSEPPWWLYLIGFVAGTLAAVGVCLFWMPATTSAAVAALGGIGGVAGVCVLDNIVEAVITSCIFLMIASAVSSFVAPWMSDLITPFVVGHCLG